MAAPQARAHQGDMHAPAPSTAPSYSTPAQLVGSQFVQQYYTVLHSTPRYLHRFYTDISTMSHNDAEGSQIFTVQSQKEIHEKVMLLDFDEAITEIWSVDCQHSASQGVLVQVAGSLQCKGKNKRSFVQTFFLAVQEKGYFVLNDIFRYLPEAPAQSAPEPAAPSAASSQAPTENGSSPPTTTESSHQSYPQPSPAALPPRPPAPHGQPHDESPTTPGPMPAPMVPRSTPAAEQSAVSAPPQQPMPAQAPPTPAPSAPEPEAMPTPQQQQEPLKPATPPEAEPEPELQPEALPEQEQQDTWTAPPEPEQEQEQDPEPARELEVAPTSAAPAEPAVPLTYAQRLMMSKAAQQPAAAPARAQPKPAVPAQAAVQAPAQHTAPPKAQGSAQPNGLPIANGHADGYFTRDEGPPGTSIFVRNLPERVTTEKLAEVFGKFGALRGAQPVSLKKQKDKDTFAFVDFQEPSAQQASITGPVDLDGQQLQVVEKKPQFIRNRGGRGGPPLGRGMFRGGRSDGRSYGRDGAGGGRDGGRGRFLERGASLNSVTSDSGRGGRRGRGRDGPVSGGRGDGGRGRNSGAPRPAPARPTATPAAAPAAASAEA